MKKYTESLLGTDAWRDILKQTGLEAKAYVPVRVYPDEELSRLVFSVSAFSRKPIPIILEDFGKFMAPKLMEIYAPLIDPAWKTIDLIEHTEETIHKVVRLRDPHAKPPELRCVRTSAEEVLLTYNSPRKLCEIAKGIAQGVAEFHQERISILEKECMHKGARACVISIRLQT